MQKWFLQTKLLLRTVLCSNAEWAANITEKTLMCPPHSTNVDDFRKVQSEYSFALVLKFKSKAEAPPEVAKLLSKDENDLYLTEEMQEKIRTFWASWKQDKLDLLKMVRDLEKAAMNKGYTLALGFTTGSCQICNNCNIEQKFCIHPPRHVTSHSLWESMSSRP